MLFAYRLARDLGRTVEEIWTGMSYDEFVGWSEFYKLEQEEQRKAMRRK